MPILGGIELLAYMSSKFPTIPLSVGRKCSGIEPIPPKLHRPISAMAEKMDGIDVQTVASFGTVMGDRLAVLPVGIVPGCLGSGCDQKNEGNQEKGDELSEPSFVRQNF
jgi:hypothetical protein